jgi:sulfopyruvate decarboxylase subunit beta
MSSTPPLSRWDALRVIVAATPDDAVVATCAATSRELAAIADRPNHLYLLDAMGLTISVATGLALAIRLGSTRRVVAVDGDGSLLMNLGALATLAALQLKNILVVLLDNGVYASTAGIPTNAVSVDLGRVAAACGIRTEVPRTRSDLEDALADRGPEPRFLHVRIDPANRAGVPLLLPDPAVHAQRFADWWAAAQMP